MPQRLPLKPVTGFTLAELLIALGILGLIAIFMIPKLLNSSQSGQKTAVFKETIAALSEATHLFCLTDGNSNPNPYSHITGKVNTQKLCPSNASTQGCFGASTSTENAEPGFIMHNGATLAGFRNSTQAREMVIVDWNGSDSPNILGDDQMLLAINFTQVASYYGVSRCRVGASTFDAPSVTLYQSLYTN